MRKIKKLQIVALSLGLTAGLTGVAFMNSPVQANAAETSVFEMEDGASVRLVKDEAGIRWETSVNETWYNNTANIPAGATEISFGTLVTAAKNVASVDELVYEYETVGEEQVLKNEAKDLPCKTVADFTDGTFTYYSAIVYNNMSEWTEDERKAAYATELVARSYVKYKAKDSTEFTYKYATANDTSRCMRSIALAAYESGDLIVDEEKNINQPDIVDDYFGTAATDAVELTDGYYEAEGTETIEESNYTVAYLGAKKVGTVNGTSIVLTEGLDLGDDYTLTLFDKNGNYAKTSEFKYITKFVTNASFASDVKISADKEAYYILKEDITLSGTWSSTDNTYFVGTLDGNNHTIKGLNVGASGGLFEYLKDATIKNVSVVDAYLNDQSGVFAYRGYGKVAFENVYVSLAPQVFTAEKYLSGDDGLGKFKGGLIGRAMGSDGVTVKNSVVYMPENLSKTNGFVAGFTNVNVTVENSTFIGGNGLVCGIRSGYATKLNQDANTVICDAAKAYEYLYSNAIYDTTTAVGSLSQSNTLQWSDMQIAAYKSNHALVKLSNTNAATELKEGTNKDIIVVTEDINLGNTWLSTQTFEGVLDGNGHKFTYAVTSRSGLVKWLHGSIKNVAIDAKSESSIQNGLIAPFVTKSNAYMENVYVNTYFGGDRYNTPVFYQLQNENSVGMKNVVVEIDETSYNNVRGSIVAMADNVKNEINAENCYYIATTGTKKPMATATGNNATKIHAGNNMAALFGTEANNSYLNGGLTGYTNYNTFYDAAYAGLPEIVQKMLPAKNA